MLREKTERNIKTIIVDAYEEGAKFQDESFDDYYIFIPAITYHGYSTDEIEEFAAKYSIKITHNDENSSWYSSSAFGSLEVNRAKIDELKKI